MTRWLEPQPIDTPNAAAPTVEWEIVVLYRPEGNSQDSALTSVEKTRDGMRSEVARLRLRYGGMPGFQLTVDQIERANGVIARRFDLGTDGRPKVRTRNPEWATETPF